MQKIDKQVSILTNGSNTTYVSICNQALLNKAMKIVNYFGRTPGRRDLSQSLKI